MALFIFIISCFLFLVSLNHKKAPLHTVQESFEIMLSKIKALAAYFCVAVYSDAGLTVSCPLPTSVSRPFNKLTQPIRRMIVNGSAAIIVIDCRA